MPEKSEQKKEALSPKERYGAPGAIRPLKTYLTDVQIAIERQKESVAKIALAERERREAQKESVPDEDVQMTPQRKKLILGAAIVVLVGVVAGGIFVGSRYLNISFHLPRLTKPSTTVQEKTEITVPAIISASYEKEIDADTFSGETLASTIRAETGKEGEARTVQNIFFTRARMEPIKNVKIGKETLSAATFFSLFLSGAPDVLVRSLSEQFMLGIYYDDSKQGHVFLLLKTNSFETSFAGMLSWENKLPQELGPILGIRPDGLDGFKDVVIQNKDTRALLDRVREPTLLYSFVDRNTILITPDKETFGGILTLLNQPKRITQ